MNRPISVLTLIASLLIGCQLAPAGTRPNVLFIAVDDLNDWVGVLGGHPQARTPCIDRLAQRGTLFANAHCAAPACNPSRVAVMTGIRPSSSGIYHNPQPWRAALPDAVTLPQHFMQHGYTARGAGKIFHGSYPDPASWQDYFPSQMNNKPRDPMPAGRPLNGIPRTAHFDWGPVDVADDQMGDTQVADWVIDQLLQEHERPFFLACGIFRPHLPWYVPQTYFDLFPLEKIQLPAVRWDDLDDVPPAGVRLARPEGDHRKVIEHGQWERAVQGYLSSIAFADAQVGRVIDALDRSAHGQNTVVVLWTDHGWHLGEKQHWRKFALWERATRTPLIVVAPGVTASGQRCERPVNLIDIYPTLIELCGLESRPELEGNSLRPLLQDPESAWDRPSLTTHGRNNHALRSHRYRYIRYADETEELYDHLVDPREWHNLARDPAHAAVKEELAAWFPQRNVPEAPREGRN
jgi:arylsulfatase A-like enzyme